MYFKRTIKEHLTKLVINTSIFKVYTSIKKKIRNKHLNKTVIKKIEGIRFELQLNQLIDYNLYYNRYFEKETSLAIINLVKPGTIVFDIGANIGCHTLPIAQKLGATGTVHAFEPMEWALNKLNRNISLNSFNNIIVNNIGLSDKEELLDINFRTSWTIDNSKVTDAEKIQKVTFTTIDSYIKANNINSLDLIKIDVDGYEPKVLAGAQNCLVTLKPTLIMEFADNKSELVEFLTSFGYQFFAENNYKHLTHPVNDNKTNNLIVVHHTKISNYPFLNM